MSKYTTEVRYICEEKSGLFESKGYSNVNEIIDKSWNKIFDSNFPIFDEAYRPILCKKILKHYYTREIGAETVGLWMLWLNTKMEEIMPFYNQLYKSELLEFNPLYDVDITRTYLKKNDGSSEEKNDNTRNSSGNNNADVSSVNYDLYSDTPQGALTGVESETYLTNARKNRNNGTNKNNYTDNEKTESTTNSTMNNLEDYLETVKGKQSGTNYSDLLMKYRQTFLNIDMLIIDELDILFMQLW